MGGKKGCDVTKRWDFVTCEFHSFYRRAINIVASAIPRGSFTLGCRSLPVQSVHIDVTFWINIFGFIAQNNIETFSHSLTHTQCYKYVLMNCHCLTYQVFADILWLHPACEVSDGEVQLVDHDINLGHDGLKFWLTIRRRRSTLWIASAFALNVTFHNKQVCVCVPSRTLARSWCSAFKITSSFSWIMDMSWFSWDKRNCAGIVMPERNTDRNCSSTWFWFCILFIGRNPNSPLRTWNQ